MQISKNFYHIFMGLWFLSLTLIAIGNWSGKIRFGLGLGDIFYQLIIIGVLLIMGAFYVFNLYKPSYLFNQRFYLIIGCLLFFIFIILKMTLLRGSASSWDGRIFF